MSHSGHRIVKCSRCNDIIQQCRCADPGKAITYELCGACKSRAQREEDDRQALDAANAAVISMLTVVV